MIPDYTVPKVIDFPRYNTECSGENEILRGIFRVVSRFPLHLVLFRLPYCNLVIFQSEEPGGGGA